jgi:hypothetical protein
LSSILKTLANIPRLWLFGAIAFMVVLCFAITIPIPQAEPAWFVKNVYDAVEALEPGDWVIVNTSFPPAASDEMYTERTVMEHLFMQPGIKIVFCNVAGWGGEQTQLAVEYYITSPVTGIDLQGKVYGVDWIDIGWVPGGFAAAYSLALSFRDVTEYDRYGNHFDDLPMIGPGVDLNRYSFDMAFSVWVNEWRFSFEPMIPNYTIGETMGMAGAPTSIAAGLFDGTVPGVPGGAMYERLMGKRGLVTACSAVYAFLNTALPILIIVGNVATYLLRQREGEVKA